MAKETIRILFCGMAVHKDGWSWKRKKMENRRMDGRKCEPSRNRRTFKHDKSEGEDQGNEQRDKKGRKKKREVNPGSKEAWKLKNTG